MEARTTGTAGGPTARSTGPFRSSADRRSTETKQAFKTTEFIAYVAILIGIFVAGVVTDAGGAGGADGFGANQVWLYAVILTFGYMVSRGAAKAGSREPYDADDH